MATVSHWIIAMRLRTLPLAVACITMGAILAFERGITNWPIYLFCVLTTILLQILSNLANDYGDALSGVDSADRSGPVRMMQSGAITKKQMQVALILFSTLSLISGVYLLYISNLSARDFWILFSLGILSLLAAVGYTMGKRPYGYIGLGDLSVFVFFGWIGVGASYYLITRSFTADILLAASTCSLFAVTVLNINNVRDIESDRVAGKYSIPVRIGRPAAVLYNWALIIIGLLCAVIYTALNGTGGSRWIFLLVAPLLLWIGK